MSGKKYHISGCVAVLLLATPCAALEEIPTSTTSPLPLDSMFIQSHDSRYLQYNLEAGRVSPYVAIGQDEPEDPIEDYWHEHSYPSLQQDGYQRETWAGLKVRLHELFNVNIDAKQRNIRSTLSIAPKTKMKLRVKLNEVKAQFEYKF